MALTDIDVRNEPDHQGAQMVDGRPMLTWGCHPMHGNGWTLSYLLDHESATAQVEEHFIPGELADVDQAVESARRWLRRR